MFLSSFRPLVVLQGRLRSASKNTPLRHGLVLFQFTIAISLIIGTVIVQKQLTLFMNKDLGFSKDQVLVVKTPAPMGAQSAPFKETLRQNPAILEVSGSNTLPGRFFSGCLVRAEGIDQKISLNVGLCEPEFLDVMQLKMARGLFFPGVLPRIPRPLLSIRQQRTCWPGKIILRLLRTGHFYCLLGTVRTGLLCGRTTHQRDRHS